MRILKTPIRTPVANAFAERWIGTLRRELLDRTIVWNRRQLEHLVVDYIDHYGCKSSGPSDGVALGDELPIGPLGIDGHLLFSETLFPLGQRQDSAESWAAWGPADASPPSGRSQRPA